MRLQYGLSVVWGGEGSGGLARACLHRYEAMLQDGRTYIFVEMCLCDGAITECP